MANHEIKCVVCPDAIFPSQSTYRAHVDSKWHKHNSNCRMMGNKVLTEEEYRVLTGESGDGTKKAEPSDRAIVCMACPEASFPGQSEYKEHVGTKWHKYNMDCRMMGRETLGEAAYCEMAGEAPRGAEKEKKDGAPAAAEEAVPEASDDKATVCIVFECSGEKWSHKFHVPKGSTIMELKQAMIKPDSPPEDLVCFSLKRGMLRQWHFEIIDADETFDFDYCGVEEGQAFLDKDKARQEREDSHRRERDEAEERERRQREEAKKLQESQRVEEEKRLEDEKKRKQEEERRKAEEKQRQEQQQKEEELARKRREETRREEEKKRLDDIRKQAAERRLEQDNKQRREDAERRREGAEEKTDVADADLEVAVWIDRFLDMKSTFRVRPGTTIRAIKELLASQDPTGTSKPQDFGLMDPIFNTELNDTDTITTTNSELDLFET